MNLQKKNLERYLRVNLLRPGPRLMKKRIYRAAVSQTLRNSSLHYHNHGTRRGWGVGVTARPLFAPEKFGTHCTESWVDTRAALDRYGKSHHPNGIRSPDRPARSQSLYRLHYPLDPNYRLIFSSLKYIPAVFPILRYLRTETDPLFETFVQ